MKKIFDSLSTILLVLLAAALLLGFPLMFLWNWLMPHIFGLPQIGFWEAMGLYLLSSILFKRKSFSFLEDKS